MLLRFPCQNGSLNVNAFRQLVFQVTIIFSNCNLIWVNPGKPSQCLVIIGRGKGPFPAITLIFYRAFPFSRRENILHRLLKKIFFHGWITLRYHINPEFRFIMHSKYGADLSRKRDRLVLGPGLNKAELSGGRPCLGPICPVTSKKGL